MKTLTCREMGGMCDAALSAETKDAMYEVGMEHLREAHPEMIESINSMPKDHPLMVEWEAKFQKTWDEKAED